MDAVYRVLPYPADSVKVVYTRDAVEAEAWLKNNVIDCNASAIGFDIEWKPQFKKKKDGGIENKTSVLQLAVESSCLVLHLHYMATIPKLLREIMKNNEIKKVGSGVLRDMTKLKRDKGIECMGRVDTQAMAQNLGVSRSDGIGLQKLSERFLGVQIKKSKKVSTSNWERFPLSNSQIEYAAMDAWIGLKLFNCMKQLANERKTSVEEDEEALSNHSKAERETCRKCGKYLDNCVKEQVHNCSKDADQSVQYTDQSQVRDQNQYINQNQYTDQSQYAGQSQVRDQNQYINQNQYTDQSQYAGQSQVRDQNQYINQNQYTDQSQYADQSQVRDQNQKIYQNQYTDQSQYAGQSQVRDQNQYINQNQYTDQSQYADQSQVRDQNQYINQNQYTDQSPYAGQSQYADQSRYTDQSWHTDQSQYTRIKSCIKLVFCEGCGKKCKGEHSLAEHLVKVAHARCQYCGKLFVNTVPKKHYKSCGFSCELCGKRCTGEVALYQHMESAHVKCHSCGKIFHHISKKHLKSCGALKCEV